MRDFLKRVLLGLVTGYIVCYYGELMFWATPDREGMTVGGIVGTWLAYSVFAYVFLCVVSSFRARSVYAVALAGAFYGWYEEGIVVQTMYGTPDGPFPMSISFTGLAWHALLDVLVGWYLLRKVLAHGTATRNASLAAAIGAFYGLWAIWWWVEPPEPMKRLLDAGRSGTLLVHFSTFVLASTAVLVLAYWLHARLMPFVFRPSRAELWLLGSATLLYYALVTVPAAPRAIWVLPPLMAVTVWALHRNRRVESRPDAISAFGGSVRPLHWLLLFLIPLVAIGIYSVGLATNLRLRTNMAVYWVSSALGVVTWIASVAMLAMDRGRDARRQSTVPPWQTPP